MILLSYGALRWQNRIDAAVPGAGKHVFNGLQDDESKSAHHDRVNSRMRCFTGDEHPVHRPVGRRIHTTFTSRARC